MPVSLETYERVALEDDDEQWELVCGHLRKKPGMTTEHGHTETTLMLELVAQLDRRVFYVRQNGIRLRISTGTFYVPDLCVVPLEFVRRSMRERPRQLEVYVEPMPLVVEVWSPSTGDYDVDVKLREYQLRGDAEIWRLHPYDRTLIAWRLQPDGSYAETLYHDGVIEPVALPGVRIALASTFEI